MKIKKEYVGICNRFTGVMNDIGCEHLAIDDRSELVQKREYYNVSHGITLSWMLDEAEYWLSCYYEPYHCRYEDRKIDREMYKVWVSETGRLKRLIKAIKAFGNLEVCVEENVA